MQRRLSGFWSAADGARIRSSSLERSLSLCKYINRYIAIRLHLGKYTTELCTVAVVGVGAVFVAESLLLSKGNTHGNNTFP